jgi:hypothetical protein
MSVKVVRHCGFALAFACLPAMAAAQQQSGTWDTVLGALDVGLKPARIADMVKKCSTEEPTPSQYGRLSDFLSRSGITAPADQRRWISKFRCVEEIPVIAALPEVAPVIVRNGTLHIVTDRVNEPIYVNGSMAGQSPAFLTLLSGTVARLVIGEGAWKVDTTLSVPVGDTIRLDVAGEVRPKAIVDTNALELALSNVLPLIPDIPVTPKPVTKPTAGSSFGLAILVGGATAAAAMAPCSAASTAPSPYGGVFGGQYYGPGVIAPQVRTICMGAVGGSALFVGSFLIHAIRRAVFVRTKLSYGKMRETYMASLRERNASIARRKQMIDSAATYEMKREAERVARRTIKIRTAARL